MLTTLNTPTGLRYFDENPETFVWTAPNPKQGHSQSAKSNYDEGCFSHVHSLTSKEDSSFVHKTLFAVQYPNTITISGAELNIQRLKGAKCVFTVLFWMHCCYIISFTEMESDSWMPSKEHKLTWIYNPAGVFSATVLRHLKKPKKSNHVKAEHLWQTGTQLPTTIPQPYHTQRSQHDRLIRFEVECWGGNPTEARRSLSSYLSAA